MLECALIEIGLTLPQQLHDDYQTAYAAHRETGARGFVPQVIVAKTQSNAEVRHGAKDADLD
jgi:hypothetical protein